MAFFGTKIIPILIKKVWNQSQFHFGKKLGKKGFNFWRIYKTEI